MKWKRRDFISSFADLDFSGPGFLSHGDELLREAEECTNIDGELDEVGTLFVYF